MDVFDQEIFNELKEKYSNLLLTDEEYDTLFQRFNNLSYLDEVKPFLYAMEYLGLGTNANPIKVLNDMKQLSERNDVQIRGLACDLLLYHDNSDRLWEELKRMKEQGYGDTYLKEKSHLHKLNLLEMPRRGEQLYHNRIACGVRHICVINNDESISSFGWNKFGQCDVNEWTDIKKVYCDGITTFGVFSDGSIKITGALNTTENMAVVKDWKNIVDFKGTVSHIFGLDANGKVNISRTDCLYNEATKWNDIKQIVSTGFGHLIGLRNDGSLQAIKIRDPQGATNVSDWRDVVQIAGCTVGLKKDGTVVYAGNNFAGSGDVSKWTRIVQVAATSDVTYGLLENGDVICTSYNPNMDKNKNSDVGQRLVQDWHNVVSIWAGHGFVVGLTQNGKFLFAGDGSDSLGEIQKYSIT